MRYILTILGCIYFQGSVSQAPPDVRGNLACNNFIEIKGETNINNFQLQQIVPENEICAPGESGWIHYPGSSFYEIRIPVKNFQANNHLVYKDFLDLIKASEFPYITIQIRTNQFQEFYNYRTAYYSRLTISIAGVTRPISVECKVIECSFGDRVISGKKILKLTDFKLDPPIKSLGLIKVKNELNINFEFKIPENLITNLSED